MSLRQVYPAPGEEQGGQSKIDIIAVHGLDFVDAAGRCSVSSWREPSNGLGEVWPNAFLQQQGLMTRLFLYEYDSVDTFSTGSGRVSGEADGLLNQISTVRPKADQHTPIIFLGQGLGGILVKQALVNASQNGHYAEIKTATMGLLFFATPHQLQHNKPPSLIETAFSFIRRSNTAQGLYKSELLPELKEFHDQAEVYQFISF